MPSYRGRRGAGRGRSWLRLRSGVLRRGCLAGSLGRLLAGRPQTRCGRRRERWCSHRSAGVMLLQNRIASLNPRAIVAIQPQQDAVAQTQHPPRRLHTSRPQEHADVVIAQASQPLENHCRRAEVWLRRLQRRVTRTSSAGSGHGLRDEAKLCEKLKGIFERPAAA